MHTMSAGNSHRSRTTTTMPGWRQHHGTCAYQKHARCVCSHACARGHGNGVFDTCAHSSVCKWPQKKNSCKRASAPFQSREWGTLINCFGLLILPTVFRKTFLAHAPCFEHHSGYAHANAEVLTSMVGEFPPLAPPLEVPSGHRTSARRLLTLWSCSCRFLSSKPSFT